VRKTGSYYEDNTPIYKEEGDALIDKEKEFYNMRGWKYFTPAENLQYLMCAPSEC
jgi:hypothetical protein